MLDLTINGEMEDILSSIKWKTLKSIEGYYDFRANDFLAIVRLNLGRPLLNLRRNCRED